MELRNTPGNIFGNTYCCSQMYREIEFFAWLVYSCFGDDGGVFDWLMQGVQMLSLVGLTSHSMDSCSTKPTSPHQHPQVRFRKSGLGRLTRLIGVFQKAKRRLRRLSHGRDGRSLDTSPEGCRVLRVLHHTNSDHGHNSGHTVCDYSKPSLQSTCGYTNQLLLSDCTIPSPSVPKLSPASGKLHAPARRPVCGIKFYMTLNHEFDQELLAPAHHSFTEHTF